MNSQTNEMNNRIKDLEYEDYDYEDIHSTVDFFGEMKRLK